jgi:hypothetical protein
MTPERAFRAAAPGGKRRDARLLRHAVNELLAAAETLAAAGIEAEIIKLGSIVPLDATPWRRR